ncbi:MAG TPA: response regulator transcription factor [Candidatus Lachnoclostridium stercorigallinarum]|uniref:Stage 0 sporulation protein A homolog n=1 Tax=Candidatus Lachnoclostridium stercorigallinarum TaxID=2838634 RepID=A0A9D2GIS1_9FIRM|nr:response regulator transcription factor [Candidatus Lachnoclostridium stercorigallinarum]
MSTVLIIEDDSLIAELERDYLEAAGFDVVVELNGDSGLRQALAGTYDAVVLDVMLPGRSGFDICREVRRELNIPVIMVTAKKEDVDKIRGLGLGADDYLVKPFSPAELVARVKAHIQIHERLLDQKKERLPRSMNIRNLTIYPEERRVFSNGKELSLTNKEFELLMFLAENPNIVFSKDTIFDRIWGMDAAGNTATVTVHINRLREKVEEDPSNPKLIETVWGAGYRFRIE